VVAEPTVVGGGDRKREGRSRERERFEMCGRSDPRRGVGLDDDRGYAARVAWLENRYTWRVALKGRAFIDLRGPCRCGCPILHVARRFGRQKGKNLRGPRSF
jgi:hypothetical protein